jgi:NAD(P)-dependent dehydrogenase (short-subunit alcohol dehydrogenase family)
MPTWPDLHDRVAIVTGGSRIGRAIALDRRAPVVAAARAANAERGAAMSAGGRAGFALTSRMRQVEAAFGDARRLGRIDILVNNAGSPATSCCCAHAPINAVLRRT